MIAHPAERPLALNLCDVVEHAERLAQALLTCSEVERYLDCRAHLDRDEAVLRWRRSLQIAKDQFEEAQRFGHFHPNYHQAIEHMQHIQQQGEQIPAYFEWKQAEKTLEWLLYDVSRTIAHAVSESVQVPTELGDDHASSSHCSSGGGCSSGGSCGCS